MKIFLFDIDGTLTSPRQPMDEEFAKFFLAFCQTETVYLSTGSDWGKVLEQVPEDILRSCAGVFTCSGNAYWILDSEDQFIEDLSYKSDFKPSEALLNDLGLFLESSDCPAKTGDHIEHRTGMINFSTVGRACTQEQREEYAAWDKENKEREKIVSVLRKRYTDLSFNIGGQISIDISPTGNDKSRSIPYLREWHPDCSIHFFGDKMQPGGNDYPVLKELNDNDTFEDVDGFEHTQKLLVGEPPEAPETNAEVLKPKPSAKLAPRGIETFTICRQADESGVSGTGVVIEGVEYATGQVVLHWLTPFPKGSIAIFESLEDLKRVHVNPHPTNKTIITWSDGRQEEF